MQKGDGIHKTQFIFICIARLTVDILTGGFMDVDLDP